MLSLLLACQTPSSSFQGDDRGATDSATDDTGTEVDSGGDSAGTDPTDTETDDSGNGGVGSLLIGDRTGANLVLIHTDTLRKQAFAVYGGSYDTLPRLSQRSWLAVDGVVSSGNWTPIATASLLTANPPHIHDVRYVDHSTGQANRDVPVGVTLADHLSSEGYQTLLLTGNSLLEAELSGQTGFDTLLQLPTVAGQSNASVLADRAGLELSRMDRDRPFFLMIQAMDPHFPYATAPEEEGVFIDPADVIFDADHDGLIQQAEVDQLLMETDDAQKRADLTNAVQALYAQQVLALDRAVDELLVNLDRMGELENTVIVFTGDHGESLNDRDDDQMGHGWALNPELVQLPFLISGPGTSPGLVTCTAENADIAPTLLRAIGAEPMPGVEGVALQDGCRDWARSTWYADDSGTTMQIAVSGHGMQVTANCSDPMVSAMDLTADPFGRVPVQAGEVPDSAFRALETLGADIESHVAEAVCPDRW